MPVFSAYFKVLRANRVGMIIYVVIFLAMTLVFSLTSKPTVAVEFGQTRTPLAVINRDGDSQLVRGLTDYLAQTNRVLDYPDDPNKLQDALYFRNVQYIAIIPQGFTAAMLAGGDASLAKVVLPGAMSSRYVEMSVDKYLNAVRRYLLLAETVDWSKLQRQVLADLSVETPVRLIGEDQAATRSFSYYFNYFAYTQLALVMLGVTGVSLAFNRDHLRHRNRCSPLSRRQFSLQLAAGHGLFAVGTWLLLLTVGVVCYRSEVMASGRLGWLALNTLLFTAVCVSIGLLIGNLVRNNNAQIAMVNTVTLGMSFITGVFMPQQYLSPAVLTLAKFLPSYWYVRATAVISGREQLNKLTLPPLQTALWLQLAFAVAFLAVALLLGKEKQTS